MSVATAPFDAPRIAWQLTADVVRDLRAGTHFASTLSFTTPTGSEVDVRAGLARFVAVLAHRTPDVTLLAVLANDGASARWHVHALAVASRYRAPGKFMLMWTHGWSRHERPARIAQSVKVVGARDVWHVVKHHIGRADTIDGISLAGPLAGPWARVLGVAGAEAAGPAVGTHTTPSRARKPSTEPLQTSAAAPFLRAKSTCPWCGKALPKGAHYGCVQHEGCRQQTSRARVATGDVGSHFQRHHRCPGTRPLIRKRFFAFPAARPRRTWSEALGVAALRRMDPLR